MDKLHDKGGTKSPPILADDRAVQWACAVLLSLITLIFYVHPVADIGLEAAFVVFVGVASIYCLRTSDLRYRTNIVLLFIVPFMGAILTSMMVNSGSYSDEATAVRTLVVILNTGLILWLGLALCSLTTSRFEGVMTATAIIICSFLVLALVIHWSERFGGRFMGNGLHPNWWGAIAYGACCCAIFIQKRWLRWACYVAAVTMMLSTSSRGSLLGFAVMVAAVHARNFSIRNIALGALAIGLVGLVCLVTPIWGYIYSYLYSDVLLLDNVYRGYGSGFTGRYAGWVDALNLIADHPAFGIGPGMLPALHNGYLVILAEYGIIAGLFFFAALATSILSSKDIRISAVVLSYAAFMVFAPRTINMVLGSLIPSICMMAGLARLTWPAGLSHQAAPLPALAHAGGINVRGHARWR